MIYITIILLISAHIAAYFGWQKFTKWEVAQNAAAIKANGSADDLRAGFHQRRGWVRFWPWLGLVLGASLPCVGSWPAYVGSCLSLGILLAGFFARYFTPWLNLAMKLDYKPADYASPDSASWPDAAVWKKVRAWPSPLTARDQQLLANQEMGRLLTRTWLAARIAYAVGMIATLLLMYTH